MTNSLILQHISRLLSCLAVFDNIFIVCSVFEAIRKHFFTSAFQEYLFGYFLYQVNSTVKYSLAIHKVVRHTSYIVRTVAWV